MDPFTAAAVGQIGAGLLGAWGQSQTNAANAEIARMQMAFQERMSNTAYQRGVEDMRRAGLNPALAYERGGASTPSGASATMQNSLAPLQAGASGAAAAAMAREEFKQRVALNASTIKQQEAQTNNVNADAALKWSSLADQLMTIKFNAVNARQETEWRPRLNQSTLYLQGQQAGAAAEQIGKTQAETRALEARQPYIARAEEAAIKQLNAQTQMALSNAANASANAALNRLAIPGAQNRADFESSPVGKAMPYINAGADVIERGMDFMGRRFNMRPKTRVRVSETSKSREGSSTYEEITER